jgi:DNA-binding NarL/FixJ family response regulator
VLDPEARAILGLLAEGHSLGEAAHLLGLARRTADRRLLAARRALGVDRTTEAIARARRLGWFGRGGGQVPGG